MKLTFEIVAIWTALNFVVGIPVWMLVKLRDRREMFEKGLDWESTSTSESSPGRANRGSRRQPRPGVPLAIGAGRLMAGTGSVMPGALHRTGIDNRSIGDV